MATPQLRPVRGQTFARKGRGPGVSLIHGGQRATGGVAAACFLLAVVTIGVYSSVASHPFLNYDDPQYVSENAHIQAGLSPRAVWWALTAVYASNWHPLTWISHAVDYQLYGLEASGHHITSLAIHVVNVLLLFWFLQRITKATGQSMFVAALFALHPLNVESVAWVAERKNVLSTLFFLLTLNAYAWYLGRTNWKRYLTVVLLFIMGLASKPMVVSLPFVLLLLDYWPLRRIQDWTTASVTLPGSQQSLWSLIKEKLPLFLLSLGSALITLIAQKGGNSVDPLAFVPIRWRIQNALYSYVMYLGKIFWPKNLAVFYPHPLDSLTVVQVGLATWLLFAVTWFAWNQRARRGYVLSGWLWFLGTLVPVIGIVQVGAQGMADRYAYIPAIGIFIIVAWGFADLSHSLSLNPRYAAAVAVLVLCAISAITAHQLEYWARPYDLWMHTLEVTPNNYLADDGLAYVLLHQGRPEALGYYEAAASFAPWDPISHNAVAGSLQDRGKFGDAIHEYTIALSAKPEPRLAAHIYAELGFIYRQLGDAAQARQNSAMSLHTDPHEMQDMIDQLSTRVDANPAASGYFRLGSLLEGANRTTDAKGAYGRALELNPNFGPAQKALDALRASEP